MKNKWNKPGEISFLFDIVIKSLTALCISSLWGCLSTPERPKRPIDQKPVKKLLASSEKNLKKFDPLNAEVSLPQTDVIWMDASPRSSFQVPGIEVSMQGADLVEVLRCKEESEVATYLGQSLMEIELANISYDQARWLWQEALGNSRNCRIVGKNIARSTIPDLAAPTGKYFYLVNPCVSKNKSSTGKRACSYKLARSDLMEEEYERELDRDYQSAVLELYIVEGQLAAEINIIIENSTYLADQIRHCEIRSIQKDVQRRTRNGLLSLASSAVGAVVGYFIGGPVGSIQGANTFMKLTRNMIKGGFQLFKEACSQVEPTIAETEAAFERLESKVEEVIEIRKEMASAQEGYQEFDEIIVEQN